MRTYAVKLVGGGLGPEFSSTQEAAAWGMRYLPADQTGRIQFTVAYVRAGEEVGGCLLVGFSAPDTDAPPLQS